MEERCFCTAAEGLLTEQTSKIGYATTGLTDWARREYAQPLAELEGALVLDLPQNHKFGDRAGAAPQVQDVDGAQVADVSSIGQPKHISATCRCARRDHLRHLQGRLHRR